MLFSCQLTGILKGETDKMRHLALAIALTCLLSGVARAGEIPSTGATAPQPPSSAVTTSEIHTTGEFDSTDGEIPTTGTTAPEASNSALTIILALLGIVP
jgi:hypothetical protein